MQTGSVGSSALASIMPKVPEAVEGPGPDHDGDSDDKNASVKSATASGVGKTVDITA